MLTFEGQQFQGTNAIVEKLAALPFQKVQHAITTIDAQPSNPQQGPLLVTVTGRLLVDDEQNPRKCFFGVGLKAFLEVDKMWALRHFILRMTRMKDTYFQSLYSKKRTS